MAVDLVVLVDDGDKRRRNEALEVFRVQNRQPLALRFQHFNCAYIHKRRASQRHQRISATIANSRVLAGGFFFPRARSNVNH
jgi:hypothetical protein